ncbi:tyrosine-type recombinase/integrase [Kutzneria albida]|uniref:Tyr recombinase domain-containing protein n=1 Tax=Kutzneria albida DSM 43870 TaxID=1449976 RepID=W5WCS2_9PSEU|nr:tyrosine-type recombinase/integrase [Kutzneria albida]AHH98356.1 hypothetical protein KALB_4994 [Kutzneria albida DSM 43870]
MARPTLDVGEHGKIGYAWSKPKDGSPPRCRAYALYRFNDGTTAKRERWGKDEDEARRALLKYFRSLKGADDKITRASTFEKIAEAWLKKVYRKEKYTTYVKHRSTIRNQVIPAIGKLRLHECRPSRIQRLLDDLREQGYSSSVRASARQVMQGVFQFAILNELMDRRDNPTLDLDRIPRDDKKQIAAFDKDELREFMEAVDADRYMKHSVVPSVLRILFGTGCRIGEALAIRWCDLNLTENKIKVTHPVFGDRTLPPHSVWINGNVVHGEHGLIRHNGKTDTSEGVLYLPSSIYTMLLVRVPEGVPGDQPVFAAADGGYLRPNNLFRSIDRLSKRLGREEFSSRWGRKTVSTWLRESGRAEDIPRQLRHSNSSTAEKHYTARIPSAAAGDAIDRLLTSDDAP